MASAQRQATQLVGTIGGGIAHHLYPNDLDTYYACSLELVNFAGDTVDYFVFPVMPDDYYSAYRSLINVRKTAGSVLSVKGTGFTPKTLRISGTFGRNFRIMVGENQVQATAWKYSTAGGDYSSGNLQFKTQPFIIGVKNGYGSIKILEAICFKANQLDDAGYPYQLYFYNPAFGESYLVEVQEFNVMQNINKTNIWSYRLTMQALGNVGQKKRFEKTYSYDIVARSLNVVASSIRDAILNVV